MKINVQKRKKTAFRGLLISKNIINSENFSTRGNYIIFSSSLENFEKFRKTTCARHDATRHGKNRKLSIIRDYGQVVYHSSQSFEQVINVKGSTNHGTALRHNNWPQSIGVPTRSTSPKHPCPASMSATGINNLFSVVHTKRKRFLGEER